MLLRLANFQSCEVNCAFVLSVLCNACSCVFLVFRWSPRQLFAKGKALKPTCNPQVISLHNTLYSTSVMLLDVNMEALHLAGDTCQL